jgi:hypothetical protein
MKLYLKMLATVCMLACLSGLPSTVDAGVIFGNAGLAGGFRWDAAPRILGGLERSLNGGLRYSLQGGSFLAYRNSFSWSGPVPTVAAFQQAVEQAFAAWTVVDPVSGFGTAVSFTADLATAVDGNVVGGVRQGAEIDLFATDLNDNGTRGFTSFNATGTPVTLTSGTVNYAGSAPISGADVTMNSNAGALYTLDVFRRLLTHELGHAIGLGDVEGSINPGVFIDDNYDPTNSATALATLTNTWAALVNPLNPAASVGLGLFFVANADPGVDTPGVNILMESEGLGIAAGPPNPNPVTNLTPLTNDDYGTRQFLYPSLTAIPEPSTLILLVVGVFGILGYGWRRQKQAR